MEGRWCGLGSHPQEEGVDAISLPPTPAGGGVVSLCLCSFQSLGS